MKTQTSATELLEDIKQKNQLTSDYQLGKYMKEKYQNGWSHQTVSRFVTNSRPVPDSKAADIADALELDPGYVIAALKAGRETDKRVREIWEKIAGTMTAVCLVFLLTAPQKAVSASFQSNTLQSIHCATYSQTTQIRAVGYFLIFIKGIYSAPFVDSPLQK